MISKAFDAIKKYDVSSYTATQARTETQWAVKSA